MRILVSMEGYDLWIYQSYKSLRAALRNNSSIELFCTSYNLEVSDDELIENNVIDYLRISKHQDFSAYLKTAGYRYTTNQLLSKSVWSKPQVLSDKLAFFRYSASIVQPDVVIVWNGMADIRGFIRETLNELDIPFLYAEKGMLPESWYLDPVGINANCSLTPENLNCDSVDKAAIEKYLRTIMTSGASAWEQPQRANNSIRKQLGLPNEASVVFFPGQVDRDTNIRLFSPFTDVAQALELTARSLPANTHLICKPHPKASKAGTEKICSLPSAYPNIHILKDVNIWDMIEIADTVVSINSTTAFEALLARKKVVLLGDGVLSKVGLVNKTLAQHLTQELAASISSTFDQRVNYEKLLSFVHFLKNKYYIFRDSSPINDVPLSYLNQIPARKSLLSRDEIIAILYRRNIMPSSQAITPIPQSISSNPYKLSVVLTTFSHAALLPQVLEGFAAQSAPKDSFEIVLVDDGSTPPAKQVADVFADKLNINYIYQQNSGLAAARNTGIAAAKGDIILFHDDDDMPGPDLVAEHIKSHTKHPAENIAVLGHLDWHPGLTVTPLMHYVTGPGGQYFGFTQMSDGQFYVPWKWWGGLISAKKALLAKLNGPFDPIFRFGHEDTELICRLLDRDIKILYNANAKKTILRPIDFETFCKRCRNQGRSLFHLAQKHPAVALDSYRLKNAAAEFEQLHAPNLDKWHSSMLKYEPTINADPAQFINASNPTTQSVHKIWALCFRAYFLKGYLEESTAHSPSPAPPDTQPTRFSNANTSKILFYCERLPNENRGSSNVRVTQILRILLAHGHQIKFLYSVKTQADGSYIAGFAQQNISFEQVDKGLAGFYNHLFYAPEKPDCIWFTNLWNPEYIAWAAMASQMVAARYPSIRIIADTMDFHYKKLSRKYEISRDPQDLALAQKILHAETALYKAADCVITVTEAERANILETLPNCQVAVIPNIHQPLTAVPPLSERKNICFIGSCATNHNRDAVDWFIREIFPKIHAAKPAIEFHILGYQNQQFKDAFETHPNIKAIGSVENAEQTISQYALFVCPMLYGAGMKGKLGSAASAATPFVTTSIGAEGLDLTNGTDCFIADSADDFAAKCLTLLDDPKLWQDFSSRIRDNFAQKYSPAAVAPKVLAVLESKTPRPSRPVTKPDQPLVSIVTACYNCEDFLHETIDSIFAQTHQSWELFLLDDCSTDDTRKIIESYAARDPRIKPFYFDDNKGPYTRRNFAIERTVGKYIVIQDADDIMTPLKLEILAGYMDADPSLGIIGHSYRAFLEKFTSLAQTEEIPYKGTHEQVLDKLMKREPAMVHGAAIIRKDLFDLIGPYDTNPFGSDSVWLAKAAIYSHFTKHFKFLTIPDILMLRRMHTASQMGAFPPFDSRGRRKLFVEYSITKLKNTFDVIKADPSADPGQLLRACDCSAFLTECADSIKASESQPFQPGQILEYAQGAIGHLNTRKFVSCLIRLSQVESLDPQATTRLRNFSLLKALASWSLDLKEHARKYLEDEIRLHNNQAAVTFKSQFIDAQSTQDVLQWCADNDAFYNLSLSDTSAQPLAAVDFSRHLVSIIMVPGKILNLAEKAIQSALAQQHDNFELIVVDNTASTYIASALAGSSDPRLKYFKLAAHSTTAAARNYAVAQAKGQILALLDTDDILDPHFLRLSMQTFAQTPDADLIYCDNHIIDDLGNRIRTAAQPDYGDRRFLIRDMFRTGRTLIKPRGIIKKSACDTVGLFDESLSAGDTYDFMRRFILADLKAVHFKQPLCHRLENPASPIKDTENAASHFKAVKRFVDSFTPQELFPDINWAAISPQNRPSYFLTLVGATYKAMAQTQMQEQTPFAATIALDLACQSLTVCLKNDPANLPAKNLLDQCAKGV